jgi:RHS repeat-associated protein
MMFWNPARPTGYGAVPGYQPLPLANGANIALASAWRGRWADITGLYNIGLRPYEATSGRWLTFDSVWNEIDPNGMSFCGGDPINSMDSDGRLSAQSALNTLGQDNSTKNLYFGIAPVMQTYIQTIYGINGLSVPTGMPGEPDSVLTNPGDITGQSQRLWTIPTGQYFSYVSQTPLPDNWGQTTASWINSSGPDLMDIQLKEAGSYFKLLGAGAAVASGAEELLPELLGAEASVAAETTAADTAPFAGQKLYRVYGGDSAAGGASWSPVNPGSVANYRDVAGLPSGGASGFNNSGRFVIEGTLQDPAGVVNVRSALPLDGNSGGILEYIIPNWQKTGAIQVNRVSGVNPEF